MGLVMESEMEPEMFFVAGPWDSYWTASATVFATHRTICSLAYVCRVAGRAVDLLWVTHYAEEAHDQ